MSSNSGAGTAVGVVAGMGIAYWIAYIMLYAIIGSLIAIAVVAVVVGVIIFFYLRAIAESLLDGDLGLTFILLLPVIIVGGAFYVAGYTGITKDLISLWPTYFDPDPEASTGIKAIGFVIGLPALVFIWTGPYLAYKLVEGDLDWEGFWFVVMLFMLAYAGAFLGYMHAAIEFYG